MWSILLLTIVIFEILNVAPASARVDIVLIHTNDVHSRFESFTSKGANCPPSSKEACYGGVSRRSSFIKKEREKGPILLLDAGDQFQGTPWFYIYKGEDSSHFMNELKYDAMTLGNHEFDNGVQGLEPFMKNITFPLVCANIDLSSGPDFLRQIKKHIMINYQGVDVVVIGYITHEVPILSKTGDLKFTDEIQTLKTEVQTLKDQGNKFIIALGHAGFDNDKLMAKAIPDLDIIVGGHSHSLLFNGPSNGKFRDTIVSQYPTVIDHGDGRKTLVVQAGSLGKFVGRLNVSFDKATGNVLEWSGNPVLMDSDIPNDPTIDAQIAQLNQRMAGKYDASVGKSAVLLDAADNVCRIKECNIGNMFTDAMVSYFQDKWPDLVIGFCNGGGLRSSINKGDISLNDIITTFPFGDNIISAMVKGQVIKEVLNHAVSNYSETNRQGKFMQVSGLRVLYNVTKPENSHVKSIKVVDRFRGDKYTDLDMNAEYRIVISKYIFKGGDGYVVFSKNNCSMIEVDAIDQDVMKKYLEANSPLEAKIEGRIKFTHVVYEDKNETQVSRDTDTDERKDKDGTATTTATTASLQIISLAIVSFYFLTQ